MKRPIVKDPIKLAVRCAPAGKGDLPAAADLKDTLQAHIHECVGMAANMIGVQKRIIAVSVLGNILIMINPVIQQKTGEYETSEGCLSLSGMRRTKRYHTIRVRYLDLQMEPQTMTVSGPVAQIIQHECDHLDGILI